MVPVNAPPRPAPPTIAPIQSRGSEVAAMLAMKSTMPATMASPPAKTRRCGLSFERASAAAPPAPCSAKAARPPATGLPMPNLRRRIVGISPRNSADTSQAAISDGSVTANTVRAAGGTETCGRSEAMVPGLRVAVSGVKIAKTSAISMTAARMIHTVAAADDDPGQGLAPGRGQLKNRRAERAGGRGGRDPLDDTGRDDPADRGRDQKHQHGHEFEGERADEQRTAAD